MSQYQDVLDHREMVQLMIFFAAINDFDHIFRCSFKGMKSQLRTYTIPASSNGYQKFTFPTTNQRKGKLDRDFSVRTPNRTSGEVSSRFCH